MVDETGFADLVLVAGALAPNSTAALQTLVRDSHTLAEHLLFRSSDANEELSQLLAAFAVRLECELHKGRAPSEERVVRFNALYSHICAHVDTYERRNKLRTVLSAWSDAMQVAASKAKSTVCVVR